MEAEYIGDRRRRRVVVVGGALLAVLAAAGTYYLATRPSTAPLPPPPQRVIVVAAVLIPARTQIDQAMLATVNVPDNPTLERFVSDPASVVGSVAAVEISAGDPIAPNMYSSGNAAGLAILAPGETVAPDSPIWRAVSVSVPPDRAVGGLVAPTDHVDLFVTLAPQIFDPSGGVPFASPQVITDPAHAGPLTGDYYSEMTTKLTWMNLEVLSVDADNSLYVLRVEEHQAEEIAHVQATGASFTMGLRPAADNRDVDRTDYGQTTNGMIDGYGFPIPDMIEIPAELPSPGP